MSHSEFHIEVHVELLCGFAALGCKCCELLESLVLFHQCGAILINYYDAIFLHKVA